MKTLKGVKFMEILLYLFIGMGVVLTAGIIGMYFPKSKILKSISTYIVAIVGLASNFFTFTGGWNIISKIVAVAIFLLTLVGIIFFILKKVNPNLSKFIIVIATIAGFSYLLIGQ